MRRCTEVDINFIILDLSLQGKDNFSQGLSFLEKVLKKTKYQTPVMVVTNDHSVDTYRHAINSGASGFMLKTSYTPKHLEDQIYTVLDNFTQWKPQNTHYEERFYRKIVNRLPIVIERFIEFRRNNPSLPMLVYGLSNRNMYFWLTHIFYEYYQNTSVKILELSKLQPKTTASDSWHLTPAALEIIPAYSGTSQYEQFVITGLEHINLDFQPKIEALMKIFPNLIFLASDDLKGLVNSGKISSEMRGRLIANAFEITPFSQLNEQEIERWINYLLSLPSVCPLHSPLLGQPAATILEPKTLKQLKDYQWEVPLLSLRETLQYIVFQSDRLKKKPGELIGQECLPARIKETRQKQFLQKTLSEAEQEAKDYIEKIENELKELGHGGSLLEDHTIVRKKLKEFHIAYPGFFNSTESERVCKVFNLAEGYEKPINILIIFHQESKLFFDRLFTQYNQLKRKYPVQFNHNHDELPGDDPIENLKNHIHKADVILINFCSYLTGDNDFYDLLPYIKRNEQARVVPIIVRSCLWQMAAESFFGRKTPLPLDGKPLATHENIDNALSEIESSVERIIQMLKK